MVILTGYNSARHVETLKDVARKFTKRRAIKVWALSEHEVVTDLGDPDDHEVRWETSILLYLRPDLVDMSQLSPDMSIDGEDPRKKISPDLGREIVEAIVDRIAGKVGEMLQDVDEEIQAPEGKPNA